MKKITVNLSYYNQNEILRKHIKTWKSWSKNVLKFYSFCIVDDCSKDKATDVLKDIIFQI